MGLFNDINEVKLLGNITQDLELKRTPNGKAVLTFSLATNRSHKVGDEWKKETDFHNIVVWGNDAEQMAMRASKGTRIIVSGRLQTRKWEKDGKTNYKTEVIADSVTLIDRYAKGAVNSNSTTTPQSNDIYIEGQLF